jgi:uncharacterized sporulation protein YeaH/YhbH (DUF444 family)
VTQIIDRRLNGKNKSAVNRQRFIERFKAQIRKAASEAIAGRSVTDTTGGEKVNIPARDISEPSFHHGTGGEHAIVHPGNKEFIVGDKVPRPSGGAGGGSGGDPGDSGEGEDDFSFQLSREEFLEFFFEDLELPDLVKTQLTKVAEYQSVRAGFARDGVPSNISVVRSLRGALARRIALGGPRRRRLREVEEELEALRSDVHLNTSRIKLLEDEAKHLRSRIAAIPFIDTVDLRYHNRIKQPRPCTQAVMFCLMDVSGSMDEKRKDIAKRFFILLYLFLKRSYERIEVVFIRHHITAKEVDEDEFFYARETGGTVVSSALKMMSEVIEDRYPSAEWNIYGAQASDGENWNNDSDVCRTLLMEDILPLTQYFAYVEITPDRHQSLWQAYETVAEACPQFAMRKIDGLADIYPVFRNLLKKRHA